eukprot:jgi/Mesen1/6430/ME000329S05584
MGNQTVLQVTASYDWNLLNVMQPLWQDWRLSVVTLLLSFLIYEQLLYKFKSGHVPGPGFTIPIVGSIFTMISDPTKYWNDQAKAAQKSGLSWNVLLGNYTIFIKDSDISQTVMANVHPKGFRFVGHPLGKKLFGEHNMIFMTGDEHKELRRRLSPMFTLKALGTYIDIQERTIRDHLDRWSTEAQATKEPFIMRHLLREMNLETSQNVFVGPYLTPEARAHLNHDYNLFNVGLLALPINLPGFAFWKATKAVQRLISTLGDCARQSKECMATGIVEPRCLLDFWMVETLQEIREAQEGGLPAPPYSSDTEIGQLIFDFLFAAQDATTSSLVWCVTLLAEHPDVLARVRAELASLHPQASAPYSHSLLRSLTYAETVMKEMLRFRPPATLVPHVASVDFPLTPDYTVPKGTIVFPSLFESSYQGFSNPYQFDPDRFSADRREDHIYRRNWLMFGAGPHQCLGQRYAGNQIVLFICLLSSHMQWERVHTPGCNELLYVPTIVPKDGGLVRMSSIL